MVNAWYVINVTYVVILTSRWGRDKETQPELEGPMEQHPGPQITREMARDG